MSPPHRLRLRCLNAGRDDEHEEEDDANEDRDREDKDDGNDDAWGGDSGDPDEGAEEEDEGETMASCMGVAEAEGGSRAASSLPTPRVSLSC